MKGKRVGIADYSMTAMLFVRGLLQHQYGVAPQEIHWFRRRSEHVSIEIPPGIRIDNIGKDQTLDDSARRWQARRGCRHFAAARVSCRVRRLCGVSFPMREPSKRPIIVRPKSFRSCTWSYSPRDLRPRPDPAVALAQGFEAAKKLAFEAYEEGLSSLPWVNLDLEYARRLSVKMCVLMA